MPDVLPQRRFAAREQDVVDAAGGAFPQNILPCRRDQFRLRQFRKFVPYAIAERAVEIAACGDFKNDAGRQLKHGENGNGAKVIDLPCQRAVPQAVAVVLP